VAADLTAYNAVLEEVWTSDKIENQLYTGDPLLDRIERTSKYHIGEYALTPILTGRSAGYSVAPSGVSTALNSAGQATLKQAKWDYTHHHQQVKLEGSAIDQTNSSAVSIANAVTTEMTSSLESLRKQITRQAFSNGDSKIATTTAATSGTNVVTLGVTGAIPANTAITRRWIQPGMTVDIGTDTDRTSSLNSATNGVIASVNSDTTFTVTGGAPVQTTSTFVQVRGAALGSATPANRRAYEMYGLPVVIAQTNTAGAATYYHPTSTTGFGNIDVLTEPEWRAASVDATTTTLNLPALYDGQRAVLQRSGDHGITCITSLKQQQAFYELLQLQVRFGGDNALGAGNVGGASFANMKVDAHVDCPDNYWFFVNLDDLLILKNKDPYWQNSVTGGRPLEWQQGTTAFVGMLTYRLQLGCRRRNSHAVLNALT
jgi:hypothetical protein